MVSITPIGLAAAPVANKLSVLAAFREKLCHPFCTDSLVQPQVTVTYNTGVSVLNGTTVFVPVQATITIVIPSTCGCSAKTQLFSENFVVAFQGQTALPTAVTITSVGRIQGGACVRCGRANSYSINDSLTIAITPPAAAAAN